MNRFDALITTQKKTSLRGPILKTIKKNQQKCPFFKNTIFFAVFLIFSKKGLGREPGFLRCNNCIKTLHLRYKTALYNDFQFLPYNVGGGSCFFRPQGWKIQFKFFSKEIQFFLYLKLHLKHQGIKSIPNNKKNWGIRPPPTSGLIKYMH